MCIQSLNKKIVTSAEYRVSSTYLDTLMHSMRLAELAKTHASDSVDRSLDFSVR